MPRRNACPPSYEFPKLGRRFALVQLLILMAMGDPVGGQQDRTEVDAPLGQAILNAETPADSEPPEVTYKWHSWMDGDELTDWQVTNFGGEGQVMLARGLLSLEPGSPLTGITYRGRAKLPTTNYEVRLKARRMEGHDFFCGLTFPIDRAHASLIIGGWGGGVVGISCIDHHDASENETTKYRKFENQRWYAVRLRVTDDLLEAWIDNDRVVDVDTKGHEFEVRTEVMRSRPWGLAAFESRVEIKDFQWRNLPPEQVSR